MADMQALSFEIVGKTDTAVRSLNALKRALTGLKDVKIGKLGLDSAAEEIDKFSAALNKIEVDKVGSLQTLAEGLSALKESVKGGIGQGMKSFTTGLSDLTEEAQKLESSNNAVAKMSKTLSGIANLGNLKISTSVGNGIRAIGEAAQGLSQQALDNLDNLTRSLQRLTNVDVKGLAANVRSLGKRAGGEQQTPQEDVAEAMSGTKGRIAALGIRQVGDAANWSFNAMQKFGIAVKQSAYAVRELVKTGMGGVFKAFSAPLRGAVGKVTQLGKSLSGVVGGFKRILGYRIIRAIIKEITQAVQEGVKNLYGWSKGFDGALMGSVTANAKMQTFAQTMDGLATSLGYFKNTIGAAVAPLISALAPAIDWVIDKVVALINVINQLLALLGGATSWNKAIKKSQEYEDATSGAGGAAKEALKYLAPFDELNVLPDDKKGGGGGGGTDYSGMFEEETEFLEGLKDFTDALKERINEGDWQGVGELLGGKINDIVGYLEDGDYFAKAGQKIGYYINAWFSTKYWTLETINFSNIGGDIADMLNNALAEIDFDTVGRSLTQKFTILGDLIVGAVNNIDWSLVGQSIGNTVRGAFDQVSTWLEGIDWVTFGYNLYNDLKAAVQGIDFASVARSLFELFGAAIGAASAVLTSFIITAWNDIKGYFAQYIPDGATWAEDGKAIIEGILQGMLDAVKGVASWIQTNVFEPLRSGIKSAFGIASPASTMIPLGEAIGDGILEGLLKPFKSIGAWIQEHILDPIKEKLQNFSISDLLTGGGDDGSGGFTGKFKLDGIIETIEDKVPAAKKFIEGVKSVFGSSEDKIPVGQKIVEGVKSIFGGTDSSKLSTSQKTISTWSDFKETIKSNLSNDQRTISTWSDFKQTIKGNLTNDQRTISTWSDFKKTIKGNLSKDSRTISTWSNFKAAIKGNLSKDNRTIATYSNYKSAIKSNLTSDQRTISTYSNYTASIKGNLTNDQRTIPTIAKFTSSQNGLGYTPTVNVVGKMVAMTKAKGGAFYGGAWHNIPQYASGGRPHGSLFLAGEAGAELVGHVGGRTEVLNQSQLAAVMSSSVARAIAGTHFTLSGLPIMSYGSNEQDTNEETMYRAFKRALEETDFGGDVTLDGYTLYNAMVQRNQKEKIRTGVNPMIA